MIDEVQKVPALLGRSALAHGEPRRQLRPVRSSATKVQAGRRQLLGGRAVRHELLGITGAELGDDVDLTRLLNVGYLPRIFQAPRPVPS